jgi:ribosomal protein L37AE/L43A
MIEREGMKKVYRCKDCNKKVLKRQYSKQFEMYLCDYCLIDRIKETQRW